MARNNEFSDEEKRFIKDNKDRKFIREMASELSRSVLGVKKVIQQIEDDK